MKMTVVVTYEPDQPISMCDVTIEPATLNNGEVAFLTASLYRMAVAQLKMLRERFDDKSIFDEMLQRQLGHPAPELFIPSTGDPHVPQKPPISPPPDDL